MANRSYPLGISDERLAQLREMTNYTHADLSRAALTELAELGIVFDELAFWRTFYGKFEERLSRLESAKGK